MAIQGDLQEMHLPNLVQLILQSGVPARIQLRHEQEVGVLYIADKQLLHAEVAVNADERLVGADAVYHMVQWENGQFKVDRGVATPQKTLAQSWDFLLMEGLRRMDEKNGPIEEPAEEMEDSFDALLENLHPDDVQALQELLAQQEKQEMASKSEQIRSILSDVVNNSTDIVGAAVVDNDGLLLASVFSGAIDGNRVAAVSAGLISLASRSAQQLNQGAVKQTIIQADNGNIIAVRASAQASFVALTPTGVNLGMAFMECRDAAQSIAEAL